LEKHLKEVHQRPRRCIHEAGHVVISFRCHASTHKTERSDDPRQKIIEIMGAVAAGEVAGNVSAGTINKPVLGDANQEIQR
jgi:hypothetical protein